MNKSINMKKLKKLNKSVFFLFALILSGLVFSACQSDDPIKVRNQSIQKLYKNGSVKIAVSNSFEYNKSQMWNGVLLAQEKINKEKLLPVNIELVKYDDGGDSVKGITTAYDITSDPEICAVIGHGYSDISLPCSLIYQYYGILTFNFISTVHSLTERNNPLIFSNMPDDNHFGNELPIICEKNGYSNVIIYYLENTSGTSLSNSFEMNCNKHGISVVSRDSYDITTSTQEFERMAKRWKNNFLFDAVFIAGRMPYIKDIIEVLRNNGIDCPVVGADPFDDPLLTQTLTSKENGRIFAVSNYDEENKNPKFQEFYNSFIEKYAVQPDQEALQAYDALMVLADAIRNAGSAVPVEIASALHEGSWNEASGPYSFTATGAIQNKKLTQKVFKDGKFVQFD